MDGNYRFANLSSDDRQRLKALEEELGANYPQGIVLIAYEKASQGGDSANMEVGTLGAGGSKRGTTFGYGDPHGDHFPTLGQLMFERSAEGEDIRFSDAEPPNREEAPAHLKRPKQPQRPEA